MLDDTAVQEKGHWVGFKEKRLKWRGIEDKKWGSRDGRIWKGKRRLHYMKDVALGWVGTSGIVPFM